MVYQTTDDMSAVKKMSIRRGIKSPFSGKSSKKTAKLNATDGNFVVGDDCAAVAAPIMEESAAYTMSPVVDKDNDLEMKMDPKTRPILTKMSSKKSYKWPFRRRRSEDNENVNSEPKTNLSNDHGAGAEAEADNGQPGSKLENNGEMNGIERMGSVVSDNALNIASENQSSPPTETGTKHIFCKNVKVTGYVVPLRRQQEQPGFPVDCKDKVSDKSIGDKMQEISLMNGFLEESHSEEMRDDFEGPARDLNGNPPISATTDVRISRGRYPAPELPLPLKNHTSEPELPPRPPKPASLRYRPPPAEPCTSFNGVGDKLEEDEIPPRPPARPKNRTLGGGSLWPWNNLLDESRKNRATVYETISLEPKEASLAKELAKLPRQPWYWGPLTQAQAEDKLAKLPDGSFLVRDSSDERYLLSLSFNSHGRTLHTRIEHRNSLFSLNDSDGHLSVVELIECAVKESRNGVYGYMRDALGVQSFPARLTNWVSRFTEMRSLQHLCRFLIREVYPRHHIQRLPLPKKIKEYILENQY